MAIYTLQTSGLSINTYVIADTRHKMAAVCDPTRDIRPIVALLKKKEYSLSHIIETHVQADFISGAKELKAAFGNKPIICCSGAGGPEWVPSYSDKVIMDGQKILLGEMCIQARHTPGHTFEHMMWIVYNDTNKIEGALTGDFLFVGSVGRPDLIDSQNTEKLARLLYASVFNALERFPDEMPILPAHGQGSFCGKGIGQTNSSTLGQERATNPMLRPKEESLWIKDLLKEMPPAPDYFKRVKKMNLSGPILLKDLPQLNSSSAAQIVDIRDVPFFSKGHLKGAINIPFMPPFINWSAQILNAELPTVIAAHTKAEALEAYYKLLLIGFDNIRGIIELSEIHPEETTPLIKPEEAKERAAMHPERFAFLDVRTAQEWSAGHIEGATHVELSKVREKFQSIPRDKEWAVVCGAGNRAAVAASFLQSNGFPSVAIVEEGMKGWQKLGLPLATDEHG